MHCNNGKGKEAQGLPLFFICPVSWSGIVFCINQRANCIGFSPFVVVIVVVCIVVLLFKKKTVQCKQGLRLIVLAWEQLFLISMWPHPQALSLLSHVGYKSLGTKLGNGSPDYWT